MPETKIETANDKFRRLANKRVPNAMKQLKLVENLFTGQAYAWTEEQGQEVIKALSDIVCRITDKAENAGKVTEQTQFHI